MKEKLQQIKEDALKQIQESEGLTKLNDVRVSVLGKKGELTQLMKSMKKWKAIFIPIQRNVAFFFYKRIKRII